MATLMSAVVTLLGQDLDDAWTGTTTGIGNADKLDLVDDTLYEKVPDWVRDGMIVYLPLGPDGASAAESRVVDSLSGNTLDVKSAFSAQVQTAVGYEVHRLFTRNQKLVALRNAAPLMCPGIHAVVRDMETVETTDYKFEYNISSLSIYQNRPHQLLLAQQTIRSIWVKSTAYISGDYVRPTSLATFTGLTYKCTTAGTSDTTEPTWPTTVDDTVVDGGATWTTQEALDYSNYPKIPLHDWDVTPDGKLFLNSSYDSGYKIMVVGIKPLVFTSSGASETIALDSPFTLVLSAQAAVYLCKQKINTAGSQDIERWTTLMQSLMQELVVRKQKFWMKPPDGTLISGPGLTV